MNTDGTLFNKYMITNPKLCEINNILINHVNSYDKRFVLYKTVCE